MIHIQVDRTIKGHVIVVQGHANYAEKGKDIVCAGVSALFLTLEESIQQLTVSDVQRVSFNDIQGLTISPVTVKTELLVKSFVTGVKMIANTYPKYVEVLS